MLDIKLRFPRDGVRLAQPVEDPSARGGRAATANHLNRGASKPPVSLTDFAAWVMLRQKQLVPAKIVFKYDALICPQDEGCPRFIHQLQTSYAWS